MHKIKISVLTLFLLSILLLLHIYAMEYHFYIQYKFYDVMMHFLGGLGLAMSIYCFAVFTNWSFFKNHLWRVVAFTFILGILWELFEIKYDLLGHPFGSLLYQIDTVKDLIMDTLGAVVVWGIIRIKKD